MAREVTVRTAESGDLLGVRRVLDAAMLQVRGDLGERIDAEDVLVADDDASDSVLGALVLVPRKQGAHIDAVAVRRARRAQGVGTALVRTAAERRAPLTAEFDPGVRPFYESLDFEISPVEDDGDGNRLRGRYD